MDCKAVAFARQGKVPGCLRQKSAISFSLFKLDASARVQ